MITYLINSTLCLLVLLAVYHFFLEKEQMHHFKRFFLLFGLVFGLLICLVTIKVKPTPVAGLNSVVAGYVNHQPENPALTDAKLTDDKFNQVEVIMIAIYVLGVVAMCVRFAVNIARIIINIIRGTKIKLGHSTLVLVNQAIIPHSFLNYIFLNGRAYRENQIDDKVFIHEHSHIKQRHTIDIMLIEILMIVFWFNPVFVFYKKAIQLNHEFLADETTVRYCGDVSAYQQLLLKIASFKTIGLANNLNYSITKKRLIMMKAQTSKTIVALKALALAPLLAVLVILFSNMTQPNSVEYALLGNESFPDFPKYELDLFSGNQDMKKSDEFIWLSIGAASVKGLSNGEYVFMGKNATTLNAFRFWGAVKYGKERIRISDGSFKVAVDKQTINVDYDLTLVNGTKVMGHYNGKYQTEDWRHNWPNK